MIIAVVGMPGSGKSVVCDYIEKHGFTKIHFGGLTIDEVKKRGLPVSEKNEKKIREELRKKHGKGAYTLLHLEKIKKAHETGRVLIDGLYSWDEYKILKKEFGDKLLIMAVYASPKTRYARLATRALRPLTKKEAEQRDCAEIEQLDKGGPIAMADVVIINEGNKENLVAAARDFFFQNN